jgi:hypothetical protein
MAHRQATDAQATGSARSVAPMFLLAKLSAFAAIRRSPMVVVVVATVAAVVATAVVVVKGCRTRVQNGGSATMLAEHSSSVDGETRRCVTKDGNPLEGVAVVVASRELAAGRPSSAMRLQQLQAHR